MITKKDNKPKISRIDNKSKTLNLLNDPEYTEIATTGPDWSDSVTWSGSWNWGGANSNNIDKPNIS